MTIPYKDQSPLQKKKYAASAKKWKQKNADKITAYRQAYKQKNADKISDYHRRKRKAGAGNQIAKNKIYNFQTGETTVEYDE